MNSSRKPFVTVLALFFVLPLICACVGGQSSQGTAKDVESASVTETTESGVEKLELASVEEMVTGAPLAAKYDNIIIGKFESSAQIQTDYPKAAQDCEQQMVKQLKSKKSYTNVTDDRAKKFSGKTAVVDLKIVDMRITSSSARFWGGAFVGSSFMNVMLEVRNAGSDEVVHQKLLSTSNNAWAAAYSGGSSDQNLPADFGVLVGEYLSKIIPAK
jgi:hypothetical protein